jgi:hypothetical protein
MTHTVDDLNWPADVTDEQKRGMILSINHWNEKQESLHINYVPECGCDLVISVLIDRRYMPKKMRDLCPHCKKGYLWAISDPHVYYIPKEEKEYTAEECKEKLNELKEKYAW